VLAARSETAGYAFMEEPQYLSIISVAGTSVERHSHTFIIITIIFIIISSGLTKRKTDAAYSNPPVEEVDGELRLSGPAIVNNFKKKIRAIFNMALANGV
jgi:hypothetical protein